MSEPIIQIEHLNKTFGAGPTAVHALEDINLAVQPGEIFGIIGLSGAGKSTLFLNLNGVLQPSDGEILLDGVPVKRDRKGLTELRRRVGIVFQDPDDQLFSADVYRDISFGAVNLGLPEAEVRRRVEAAMERTGVSHLRDKPTHALSFGQKKRVAIAGVLAMHPEVLILDEPTAGLDPRGRDEILGEIEKLHRNAKTVSQYKLATMEMVGAFYRFCANNFIDFKDYCAEVENPYEKVPEMDESTLKGWLVNSAVAISEELKNARNTTSRRIVEEAKGIVRDRYMQPDLSLDTVCSELGVSNSYFSSLFKKETGKTFISWLTDYRMDHAADLMLETNEKSYKIAERVGYQDANYFSYVFKKRFGMSPSKYRTSHKK